MPAREPPGPEEQGARRAAVALVVAIVSALAAAVVYWRGGNPQLEGLFLGLGLAAIGVALVTWAHHLLPDQEVVQPRHRFPAHPEERPEVEEAVTRGGVLTRRAGLRRLLLAAAGAFGVAAAFPIRSLGPRPGNALRVTSWRAGRRLVDGEGRPVAARDVPPDGLVTVFPDGSPGSPDGQAVLIRLPSGGAHGGFVAYSKLCTHAGCPVGLYDADDRSLLCPCHQSAFSVVDGGRPLVGPAARPLPQLPLRIADDGFLEATGDFTAPPGPAWWTR